MGVLENRSPATPAKIEQVQNTLTTAIVPKTIVTYLALDVAGVDIVDSENNIMKIKNTVWISKILSTNFFMKLYQIKDKVFIFNLT